MAFQNCNVNKLQNSINKVDNIDYSKLETLMNDLDGNNWYSNSRTRIITAIKEIINEYKNIQKKLGDYKEASYLIEEYQNLEDDYNNYRKKANNYKNRLADCDENDIMRDYYDNKVSSYNSKVSNNKEKMNELKKK